MPLTHNISTESITISVMKMGVSCSAIIERPENHGYGGEFKYIILSRCQIEAAPRSRREAVFFVKEVLNGCLRNICGAT